MIQHHGAFLLILALAVIIALIFLMPASKESPLRWLSERVARARDGERQADADDRQII